VVVGIVAITDIETLAHLNSPIRRLMLQHHRKGVAVFMVRTDGVPVAGG